MAQETTPLTSSRRTETTPRTERSDTMSASWKKEDYIVLMFNLLVKLGDSVEIYLPGVITQAVSCELGVSDVQEGLLGIAMFVTMAASILVTAPLANRFGRKPILLLSLYSSIIFTILCAVVPSYYTLLLARALIGLCVGLNMSIGGVYFAEHASSRDVYNLGTFLSSFVFAAGGGWVAILGFLLLERVGWRVFVLCTSIPLFLPPILMLHCCLQETGRVVSEEDKTRQDEIVIPNIRQDEIVIPNIRARIVKVSLLVFINIFQGYGSILLLPGILREYNQDAEPAAGKECEVSSVHGSQFLILAVISGGANLVGRGSGYLLTTRLKFRVLQSVLAGVIVLCYGTMLLNKGIVVTVVAMGLAKMVYSMMRCETSLISFDPVFFGTSTIAMASAIVLGCGMVGSAIANACAAFLGPYVAVVVTFALSLVQVGVVCSITER